MDAIDVLIVGGGPAGLMAASALARSGVNFLLVERGKSHTTRVRSDRHDVANGLGGAGLFSDGKFSYYPSASSLWTLENRVRLSHAYDHFCEVLCSLGMSPPTFPESVDEPNANAPLLEAGRKRYRSDYLDLAGRLELITQLVEEVGPSRIVEQAEVIAASMVEDGFHMHILRGTDETVISCRRLVFAGGRFGPLALLRLFPELSRVFLRYEVGVRVEQDSDEFVFYEDPQVDPKVIVSKGGTTGYHFRTFCCCRDGEVVETESDGMLSCSGRADEPMTERSNIGVNLRILDPAAVPDLAAEAAGIVVGSAASFRVSAGEFFDEQRTQVFLGKHVDRALQACVKQLFPRIEDSNGAVYGPTIEGVGDYPSISSTLRCGDYPIWIAGDSVGQFRGLSAAMISGSYVGRCIAEDSAGDLETAYSEVFLKVSATDPMPSVFTAQSKVVFYCRDAICEYVLALGRVPLNPFRVFGYFLDDRVDRDLVRRGNNHLVSMADELWVFGPISDGVLFEIASAQRLGKAVRFYNVATKASEIRPLDFKELVFEPEVHSRGITKEALLRFVRGVWHQSPRARQLELPFEAK